MCVVVGSFAPFFSRQRGQVRCADFLHGWCSSSSQSVAVQSGQGLSCLAFALSFHLKDISVLFQIDRGAIVMGKGSMRMIHRNADGPMN